MGGIQNRNTAILVFMYIWLLDFPLELYLKNTYSEVYINKTF